MSSEEAAELAAEATESPVLSESVEYSSLNLKHSPSPTLEEGHVMSDRVQSLASQIYTEFENMIKKYDEEVVKDLMPLIVTVLENLERAITERGQFEVSLELLKEDNHQLLSQFEREKQMRKTAEDRMFLTEEAAAEEKAKFSEDKDSLQSICKMLELKARNAQEQPAALPGDSLPTLEVIDVVRLDDKGFKVPIAGCSNPDPSQEMYPPPGQQQQQEKQQQQQQQILRQPPSRLMPAESSASNEASLYEEVSAGGDAQAIEDIDLGADIVGKLTSPGEYSGMSREIENLIKENADLIETKNALNIVKDDLIAKVDELTGEKDMLQEEVSSLTILKNKLKEKLTELEAENKSLREEAKKAKRHADRGEDEDESVPMAQRKRFTRVEMSRVLMERNQYKERLMELQEAVRWTEMLRANREPPQELKKKRGSLFGFANFFKIRSSSGQASSASTSGVSGLASGSTPSPQQQQLGGGGGLRYRPATSSSSTSASSSPRPATAAAAASSTPLSPAGDPTRAEREAMGLPASQNRAYDFLSAAERRPQPQQRQQQQHPVVRLKPEIATGRQHAYGWALPSQQQSTSSMPIPVPIYCRPLLDKAKEIKVWCAAAVSAGLRRQFNLGDAPDSPELTSLSEQLSREQAQFGMLPDVGLTSVVWICTSEQSSAGPSQVCIIDANRPAELLQAFTLCQSQVLAVTCVPGPAPGDFQPDDAPNIDGNGSGADVDPLSELASDRARLVRCVAVESPNQSPHASSLSLVGSPPKQQQPQGQQKQRTGTDLLIERGLSSEPTASSGRSAHLSDSTMWLGCQNGLLFIHSAVNNWRRCLQCLQLKDAIVAICHLRGRAFLGLANGSLLVFCRRQLDPNAATAMEQQQQCWDLSRYYELAVSDAAAPVRAMAATAGGAALWIGVQNTIKVVDPRTLRVAASFDAHPRADSTVRLLCPIGEGVWIGFRLDTVLRLFHAHTHALLQEIDIEPYISQVLGTSRLGFSLVRLTSLFAACGRLWIGTSNGIIVTVPFVTQPASGSAGDGVQDSEGFSCLLPHVSMELAQLSFHGHKDAVKFFLAVPASESDCYSEKQAKEARALSPRGTISRDKDCRTVLLISGGEGYIDFRVGEQPGSLIIY
uniref:JNK-interacting protein 3 n=1 Tax=Macrostomum lignano TaxID=282301 RepID=A0A1I8G6R8_9PLAT